LIGEVCLELFLDQALQQAKTKPDSLSRPVLGKSGILGRGMLHQLFIQMHGCEIDITELFLQQLNAIF
ncbi:hypothetical protein, partial [Cohaesibacter gelatinilyticus]|uniref:hypothetical protein n=1 Tax=Cohaesibacter gelatinilyticus TaxID=372072 RepID=UPI001AEC77D8